MDPRSKWSDSELPLNESVIRRNIPELWGTEPLPLPPPPSNDGLVIRPRNTTILELSDSSPPECARISRKLKQRESTLEGALDSVTDAMDRLEAAMEGTDKGIIRMYLSMFESSLGMASVEMKIATGAIERSHTLGCPGVALAEVNRVRKSLTDFEREMTRVVKFARQRLSTIRN